jgi:hypothetical protein
MEKKTLIALVVIVCAVIAVVALVIYYSGGSVPGLGERNQAKDYILDELEGNIVECSIEDGIHKCHLVYDQNGQKGQIWIYYFPGGIEPYKNFTLEGDADQMISTKEVIILLEGNLDFRREACSLYNEKYGFNCTAATQRKEH